MKKKTKNVKAILDAVTPDPFAPVKVSDTAAQKILAANQALEKARYDLGQFTHQIEVHKLTQLKLVQLCVDAETALNQAAESAAESVDINIRAESQAWRFDPGTSAFIRSR